MKKLILVGAAGLLLATANTPPAYEGAKPEGELTSVVAAESPAAKPKPAKPAHVAAAATGRYPRCSATVRDRCVQGHYRSAPVRHREVQYAMRAGERG